MGFLSSLILLVMLQIIVSQPHKGDLNSSCLPASPTPTDTQSCRAAVSSLRYCKGRGVKIDSHVFVDDLEQIRRDESLERMDLSFRFVESFQPLKVRPECRNAIDMVYCSHYFTPCDKTGKKVAKLQVCRETCEYFWRKCDREIIGAKQIDETHFPLYRPYSWNIINCTLFPPRHAGHTPECWYYNGPEEKNLGNSSQEIPKAKDECVYRNGISYQGNISVTSSGIACQSWTSQCPHRHTMNSTYPELNTAGNYCRNAGGSGERPWCFTTDRTKRWEYCDVPTCLPVNGNYSEWNKIRECSVTCGRGMEVWHRTCDSPVPRYDGNNCTSLGQATEYRNCTNVPPCPVNGGYGEWQSNSTCNSTCGVGYVQKIRSCNKPSPAHGGHDCSRLGKEVKWDLCEEELCKDLKSNSEGLLQQNAGKTLLGTGVAVVLVFLIVVGTFGYRKWRRLRMKEFDPYAVLHFQNFAVKPTDNTKAETNSATESTPPYGNLTSDGAPIPGMTRGIIPYRRQYSNDSQPFIDTGRYSKLPLFGSIVIDWMRDTWGQVDRLGRHVYDLFIGQPRSMSPYGKPRRVAPANDRVCSRTNMGAIDDNDQPVYDHIERRSAAVVVAEIVARQQKANDDVESSEVRANEGESTVC